MAIVQSVTLGDRIPAGTLFYQTFRTEDVLVAGDGDVSAGDDTEHIDTGFSEIVAVVGYALTDTATSGINFVLNSTGTGTAEGTNPGLLAIESVNALDASAGETIIVTVLGRI